MGFLGGAVEKNLPANAGDAGDVGLTPGSGISPGEGNGNPLQRSQRVRFDATNKQAHTYLYVL